MSTLDGPVLGINPKMYRHFAVITIVISATVAMFADGDRREAISDNIHQRQQKVAMQRQERDKLGITYRIGVTHEEPFGSSNKPPAHWGSDSGGSYGSPTMQPGGDDGSTVYANLPDYPAGSDLQIDPQMLAKLTPEQRAAYLKKVEEERRRQLAEGPARPSANEIDSLIAASAQRSGAGS